MGPNPVGVSQLPPNRLQTASQQAPKKPLTAP